MSWQYLVNVLFILFLKSVMLQELNYFPSARRYAAQHMHKYVIPNSYGIKKGYYILPQKNHNPNLDYPHSANDLQESIMYKLASIAQNDDLQCVPKLICEITSDTITGRQQGLNLPISVNMESLLGLMSGVLTQTSSPIIHFGKAALVGAVSKGNSRSCEDTYPDCPSDPDRLIHYLNNHNGGFFRYFNGVQTYPEPEFNKNHFKAEKRIQNKEPFDKFISPAKKTKTLIFPNNNDIVSEDEKKSFTFPTSHQENYKEFYNEKPHRVPKKLISDNFYFHNSKDSNSLDFQRPLPNHKANPTIFPHRTGTGELILDQKDIDDQYYHSVAAEGYLQKYSQNLKKISFPK